MSNVRGRANVGREFTNFWHKVSVAHSLNNAAMAVVLFLPASAETAVQVEHLVKLVNVPLKRYCCVPVEMPILLKVLLCRLLNLCVKVRNKFIQSSFNFFRGYFHFIPFRGIGLFQKCDALFGYQLHHFRKQFLRCCRVAIPLCLHSFKDIVQCQHQFVVVFRIHRQLHI